MWQKEKTDSSVVSLALLLALATTPMAVSLFVSDVMLAQSSADVPSFPLPKTVASGTTVRIDGSSSMVTINQNLKDRYEKQFSGTKVEVANNGTDAALKALLDGKIDLAAIGRGLTPQEKAQGLEQVRLRREKIAIAVGEENPFQGGLTSKQFAQIFRGEITDWSQVGGAPGKIRVIDRPLTSDTRESFRDYPVFKSAKFATGSTASQLAEDNTALAIQQLGKDGITYVIANQISKLQGVRVLAMHKTLPSDARYPFSQPLVYVYKKNPSPAIAGFLGFSTAAPGQQAIEEARAAEAAAIAQGLSQTSATATTALTATTTAGAVASPLAESTPGAVASPLAETAPGAVASPGAETATNTNTTNAADGVVPAQNSNANSSNTAEGGISPWWWLLALPVIGAALWWLAGRRRSLSDDNSNILESTPTQPRGEGLTTTALGASTAPTVGNLADSTAQTASNLAEEANTSVSNIVGNVSSTGGAALAGGTAVALGAAGIWSAASNRNSETEIPEDTTQASNIQDTAPSEPGEDVWDVEAPIAVVNPSYPDLPDAAGDVWNDNDAEVTTTEITTSPDVEPPAQSNWGDAALAGGTALAAGAASSAMWSRFSGNNSEEPEVSDITETTSIEVSEVTPGYSPPTPELPEFTELTGIAAAAPDVSDMPQIPDDEEEDWADLTEEQPAQPNWLENITNSGGTAIAGGTALAAGAGAALWSRFAGGSHEEAEAANETAEASDVEGDVWDIETPPTEPTNLITRLPNVAETSNLELPVVEITPPGSELPGAFRASNGELPIVEIIPPSQLPDAPEETFNLEAPTIEITQNQTEEEQPAQSNWLENITSSGGAALAGGTALAAGAGAALWSRLAGDSQEREVSNETQEGSDIQEDVWDIETPPREVTTPVLTADLNVEAPFAELPEITEVTSNVVSVTEITPTLELPDFPEVTSDLEMPTTEEEEVASEINWGDLAEDNDQPAQSNWVENITSSGGAVLAGGTALAAGAGAVILSGLSGEDSGNAVINETKQGGENNEKDWDIETPPTEVTIPVLVQPDAIAAEVKPARTGELENVTPITDADWEEPTTEVADVTFIQSDVTAVQFNVEAPILGQPTTQPAETTEEPDDTVVELKQARTGGLENVAPITDVEQPATEVAATTGELPNVTPAELYVEAPAAELTTPVTEVQDVTAAQLHIEASEPTVQQTTPEANAAAWGGAAAAVAGAGAASWASIYGIHENAENAVTGAANYTENTAPAAIETDAGSSIVLTPRTPKWAYVSWELSDTEKEALRQQGGSQLAVRLYNVTDIDLNYQTPQLVQQYECDESTSDRFVAIPVSDRDYIAEVGYIASEQRWLLLARSATIRVFSRLEADFWFVADTELIVHGATEPGSTVTVAGNAIKVKPDGTFHLRIPFTNDLIHYVMVAVSADKQKAKTIHKTFTQQNPDS